MQQKELVKLELLEIRQEDAVNGVEEVQLLTNAGTIPCLYHVVSNSAAAVLWVFGSRGGLDGPAGGMYKRLSEELAGCEIASLRLDYRKPGHLIDCVLDVLLGIGFLRSRGHRRITLVGYSFGGAVVINAAVSSPAVAAVAALSSQLQGADDIAELSPRPVLLLHGSSDRVRSEIGSRQLYDLAGDPKDLLVYEGCGHNLDECREQVDKDLFEWLRRVTIP